MALTGNVQGGGSFDAGNYTAGNGDSRNINTDSGTTGITLGANTGSSGSGNAHTSVPPTILVTYYIKL